MQESVTSNDDSSPIHPTSGDDIGDSTDSGQSEQPVQVGEAPQQPDIQSPDPALSGGDQAPVIEAPKPDDSPDDTVPTERQRVERASKLRRKRRAGVSLNDEETEFLTAYESTKRKPGRQPKAAVSETETPPASTKSAPTPEVIPPKSAPTKSKPRLASTPIVHESKSGASWRSKYKGASETGRELVCIQFGDAWHRLLVGMEKQLTEAGIDPVVTVSGQETRDMLILAVHDLLPSWVEATPAIVAAYQTTALSTQRLLKASAIKKAQESKTRPMVNLSKPAPVRLERIEMSEERAAPEIVEEPKPKPTPALVKEPEKETNGVLRVNSTGRFI